MVYTVRSFSSSKCSLFHNSNLFGSCIIHILYTGCAKIKKNNSGAKTLNKKVHILQSQVYYVWQVVKTPTLILNNPVCIYIVMWPRGLRRVSATAHLLGLRVRIPPEAWLFVSCECCVCFQIEVSATGRSLVQRGRTEWGVSNCDFETWTMRRRRPTAALEPWKKMTKTSLNK